MRYGRVQRRRFKRGRYGYRKRYSASWRRPRIVNQRQTSKGFATAAPQLTKSPSAKVWINFTDAPTTVAPFTQVQTGAYYQLSGYVRCNSLYNPSAMTGDPYPIGFKTYERLYDYYRPYKFRCSFIFNFLTTGTSRATDYYYLFAFPTLGATAPWDDLFSIARDMRYAFQVARANKYLVCRRIAVSTMKTQNRIKLRCPTLTLKDLAGVNPAITVSGTGVPSDDYSAVTIGTPVAQVVWHYLLVTATGYVPNFSCEVQDSYAAKTLFFGRSEVTNAVTADEQV